MMLLILRRARSARCVLSSRVLFRHRAVVLLEDGKYRMLTYLYVRAGVRLVRIVAGMAFYTSLFPSPHIPPPI